MNCNVFIKYECDNISNVVESITLNNNPDQIRSLNQLSQKGNDIWRLWAEAAGGGLLESGFGCGLVEIPPSLLGEAKKVYDQYTYLLGMGISAGIGKTLEETEQALCAAKKRGGCQLVLFTDDIPAELEEGEPEKPPVYSDDRPPPADGLAKSFSTDGIAKPTQQNFDVSEQGYAREMASYQNPEQEHTKSLQGFQAVRNKLRQHAQAQEKKENIQKAKNSDDLAQMKQKVAEVLQGLRDQMPVLSQLKDSYPDTYNAVLSLVRSVIMLGKQLSDTDEQLAKAEMLATAGYGGFGPETIGIGAGITKADLLPGGRADNMDPVQFDEDSLKEGVQHELEHTKDKDVAQEIAMDHLVEDPDYYKKLAELEKGVDQEASKAKTHFKFGKVHIRRHLKLPVGTLLNGKIKVRHYDGTVGWVSVRGGMAMSQTDPTGHPVSAKEPNRK